MTVSELLDKLKDCAPGATVKYLDMRNAGGCDGWLSIDSVISNGEEVTLS